MPGKSPQLRQFLENDPNIKADKSSNATLKSSYIFTAQLFEPKKEEVLKYLDEAGPKPKREAQVIMFRGDKEIPVVEEYVCGPLPEISKCELLQRPNRRNPVEWTVRLMWITALHNRPYKGLHSLDFAVLVNLKDVDSSKWETEKVFYSGQLFDSLDDLAAQYKNGSISKTKVKKPTYDEDIFSSLRRRGEPQPPKPQRPPRLVEPDGKRYSVKGKKVEYMGWSFHYRISPITGVSLYDVKFKGERIAYELKVADIATFYSGYAPYGQTLNNIENSRMIGSRSKALVAGAGCPETATMLKATFMNQYEEEPAVYDSALCLFEQNTGYPLRRHLSYKATDGGFFGGMLNSVLTLRSSISLPDSNYILDYTLGQNGAIEIKMISTGYIHTTFISPEEMPYGHRVQENIIGNLHQHHVLMKVDLDVNGRSNRYETLNISEEKLKLTAFPDRPYSQTKITSTLKKSEKEAVADYKMSEPKYHIVHNDKKRNKYNEKRSYRIDMKGMSKSIIEEDVGNERSISWVRHQMVVTKRKDEEETGSSIYAMLDSNKSVVKFNDYFEDNEPIVDEDLVFWISSGFQHIPHTEDIPNTAAVGNHIVVLLTPHNYYEECPSMASRDAIFIDYKDPKDPSKGVKVNRNGNSRDQCVVPKSTLEEYLEEKPDRILESRRRNPTDF
ncbi:unnamed protein product [Candidula unifasciata]|uniref:Amine oxidase n=1 Tax=Candidula unifasciata TaxID=100452 RepID=A0A8S3ZUQ1_9EUPU|nr:unnamed protein product [Candidula unifasciata]